MRISDWSSDVCSSDLDTTAPQCTAGGKCEGGDFWDVGLAYNFGSANLSAGYFSSGAGNAAAGTNRDVGIWSFNAGYKLLPNMDVYGGVNWVDIERGAKIGMDHFCTTTTYSHLPCP